MVVVPEQTDVGQIESPAQLTNIVIRVIRNCNSEGVQLIYPAIRRAELGV